MEKLQPKLRFPVFKDEWKLQTISDYFKVGSSKRVKQDEWTSEGIPFYRTRELVKLSKNEKIENEIFISEVHYNILKAKYNVPKIGDILVSGVGTLGVSYVVNDSNPFYIKDGNVIWFSKIKDIDSTFFNYSFKTKFVLSQILNNASITTVGTYTIDNAKKTKFYTTNLEEQTKIAEFLGSVDKQLELLNTKKEKLTHYKKGVMQQLFSQQLRFKDDNGNDYPEWEEKNLGEVSRITTGISNRQDSDLNSEYTFFDRSQEIRKSYRYLFDTEAIIVAGEGSDFIPKYYVGKFDLHQRTYAIMDFEKMIGKYLFYYIYNFRQYFLSQAVGSTVKSLRLPMFEKFKIQIPTIEEQTKIANFLSAIDKQIETVETEITKTETYKKGLLQQMFV